MQRNKYLDDLGIPLEKYGTNFLNDDDPRAAEWQEERKQYGFDSRECWSLDQTFIEWLYSHFMKYKEDADKTIVLSGPNSNHFDYKGENIDHLQAINIICDNCKMLLTDKNTVLEGKFFDKDTWILLGQLMPCMWW